MLRLCLFGSGRFPKLPLSGSIQRPSAIHDIDLAAFGAKVGWPEDSQDPLNPFKEEISVSMSKIENLSKISLHVLCDQKNRRPFHPVALERVLATSCSQVSERHFSVFLFFGGNFGSGLLPAFCFGDRKWSGNRGARVPGDRGARAHGSKIQQINK